MKKIALIILILCSSYSFSQAVFDEGINSEGGVVIDPSGTYTSTVAGSALTIRSRTESNSLTAGGIYSSYADGGNVVNNESVIGNVFLNSNYSTAYTDGFTGLQVTTSDRESGNLDRLNSALFQSNYLGSGDINWMYAGLSETNIEGIGAGTIQYVRNFSHISKVDNPNVTVDFLQSIHPSLNLQQGTINESQVMYLDYDFNEANLGTSLSLDGNFSYLEGGNGVDAQSAKAHLAAKGHKLRFIWNRGDIESDFDGFINVSKSLASYATATDDVLVPRKYVTDKITKIGIRDYGNADTDIVALTGGSQFGSIWEPKFNGHGVIGIRGNDSGDAFFILETNDLTGTTNDYTKVVLKINDANFKYLGQNVATQNWTNSQGFLTSESDNLQTVTTRGNTTTTGATFGGAVTSTDKLRIEGGLPFIEFYDEFQDQTETITYDGGADAVIFSSDIYTTKNIISTEVVHANSFKVNALNTAPTSSSDTGVVGEIRYSANYIYVCIATNTWKRSILTTW